MIGITGIRFQQDGKMIYYSASGLEPRTGDYVIVQTEQGMELGEVLLGVHEVPEERFQSPLPSLIRIATEQDIRQATSLARDMVMKYGMSKSLGLVNYEESSDEIFIGRDLGHTKNFSEKIAAGKRACRTKDFMICARIESLILERGMEDALNRAFAFVKAGADAIMIHSRKKDPAEIFEFLERFRAKDTATPVVVPTSFNAVTEEEFKARGVNIVIYANQLTRSAFPAMEQTAETILRNHRALEADATLMPFQDIIRMIPEEP